MDLDLTGQFLSMPFNLIGKLSDPPFWNSAILASALSAGVVSIVNLLLDHRKNRQEKMRKQLQAITQLEGRKTELLDLHMSLIQKKLDCERFKIQRYRLRPDDAEEKQIINLEYSRAMEFADSRIVDVTKSVGLLSEH